MVTPQELLNRHVAEPAILLFGPLALSFDHNSFARLQDNICRDQDLSWIRKVLTTLPQYWKTVVEALPSRKYDVEPRDLLGLSDALSTGKPLNDVFPLQNAVLIPLVVAQQLLQYASFTERTCDEWNGCIDPFTLCRDGQQTLGLCTGLLSCFAVSCASSQEEFQRYAAVAIRLGLLAGMVVDGHDAVSELGPSKSISVAWSSEDKKQEMRHILEGFPQVSDGCSKHEFAWANTCRHILRSHMTKTAQRLLC